MLGIVIPFYKIDYFEECLASLANQTDKRFKVYIGNDASPDDPSTVIKKYEDRLNIVYQEYINNLGGCSLIKQWERCIALTQDERWLMVLGDDDYISENLIEEYYRQIDGIERLDIKVIHFASRVVESPANKISHLYTHPKIEKSTDLFYRIYFKNSRGSLSEQIFRRDVYQKHGFRDFPLGWGSDNFAWLDFTDFGDIYTINNATVFFRISPQNISRENYKSPLKLQAKHFYFNLIVERYLKMFTKDQRLPLLLYYEQLIYKSNRASFRLWFILVILFYKEKDLLQAIKFTRRMLIFKNKQCRN